MWKNLHYEWQPNLGTVAISIFWYYCPGTQKGSGQPVHVVQNCSWFMLFFHPTWLPQGQITVSVQTDNYCSNNHLLVPMHIYIRLYHILFMRGTCSLHESVVNLPMQHLKSNNVNYTFLNPVHNIIYIQYHCFCVFVLFVVLCSFLCLSPLTGCTSY